MPASPSIQQILDSAAMMPSRPAALTAMMILSAPLNAGPASSPASALDARVSDHSITASAPSGVVSRLCVLKFPALAPRGHDSLIAPSRKGGVSEFPYVRWHPVAGNG